MAKQMPTKTERNVKPSRDYWTGEWYGPETNTAYLNKHAHKWKPPLGGGLHLHLIYSKQVHWRVVGQGSAVCKIPGRCYRVDIDLMILRTVE